MAKLVEEKPVPPPGNTALSIVAVVNEEIITSADLDNRLRLVIGTTNISDTEDTRARISPQLLRTMVDERLQLQEAARRGISISEEEIANAMGMIEQQRGMPPGTLREKLAAIHVPESTFTEQLRAQLSWNQLVVKTLRSKVRVSEEETARARLRPMPSSSENAPLEAVQIAVLALPVDRPEREKDTQALAEKLYGEIVKGASFEAVASELSGSATSGASKPFWVEASQLDPEVVRVLAQLPPGQVTPPLRSSQGYTLIKIFNRRAVSAMPTQDYEVVVKDILLKLKEDAPKPEVELMLGIGAEVAKHPGDCVTPGIANMEDLKHFDIEVNFRQTKISELPVLVRQLVASLPIGKVTEPFAAQNGIQLYMLCERTEAATPLADLEETQRHLLQEKLELEAQKLMRNLRREAYVEMRVQTKQQ